MIQLLAPALVLVAFAGSTRPSHAQVGNPVLAEKWQTSVAAFASEGMDIDVEVDRFGNTYYATSEYIDTGGRAFVGVVDPIGKHVWETAVLANATQSYVFDLNVDWNGFVNVLARGNEQGEEFNYLVRFDNAGNRVWQTRVEGEFSSGLGLDVNGDIYAYVSGAAGAVWLKYSFNGTLLKRTALGTFQRSMKSTRFLKDGTSAVGFGGNIFVINGQGEKVASYVRGDLNHIFDMDMFEDGRVVMAVSYQLRAPGSGPGSGNALISLTSDLVPMWMKEIGFNARLALGPNGATYVAAHPPTNHILRLVKYDSTGVARFVWHTEQTGFHVDLVVDRFDRAYLLANSQDQRQRLYMFEGSNGQNLGHRLLDFEAGVGDLELFGKCDLYVGTSVSDTKKRFYRFAITPVAVADRYAVVSGGTVTDTQPGVLRNDRYAETAALSTPPQNGSVTLESDGSFVYRSSGGFVGTDTFTYRARCDGALSEPQRVTIEVRASTGGGNSLILNPPTLLGLQSSTATLTLNEVAGNEGRFFTLRSNTLAAKVPYSVFIPAGSNTATFNVQTTAVSAETLANIVAAEGATTLMATLTIRPGAYVTGISVSPNPVKGGTTATGTVRIGQPAPVGGAAVRLVSYSASVVLPTTVTVPEGQTAVSFEIATKPVSQQYVRSVSATYGGVTKYLQITLTP